MKITLEYGGSYAPCCYIVCKVRRLPSGSLDWDETDERGTVLVQTDWDYPGIAQTFGWSLRKVQRKAHHGRHGKCDHAFTDGTVTCPECGVSASAFISSAARFLDSIAGTGKLVEDPGYFAEAECVS